MKDATKDFLWRVWGELEAIIWVLGILLAVFLVSIKWLNP